MSSRSIPPVPPNKGGELDKNAPSTEHRRVGKVEKISKVAEVDDESRARQFRLFVENANQEEDSNLPTPFSLFSPPGEASATPPPVDPAMSDAAQLALPNPATSPSPSNCLGSTAAQDESDEPPPLPQSQQFWGNVKDAAEFVEPPAPPQMEESSRSSSRIFLNKEEKGQKEIKSSSGFKDSETTLSEKDELSRGKSTKKTQGSPFGPPGKPTAGAKEEVHLSSKKEESLLFGERGKKRSAGPEGVVAPKGEEGIKYVGALPVEELGRAKGAGRTPPDERVGSQLGRSLFEEEEQRHSAAKKADRIRKEERVPEKPQVKPGEFIQESMQGQEKERGGQGKKKSKGEEAESIQIQSPTTTPLPDSSLPIAGAAAAAAKPYLGPEALSMYFHMVGTITAMVSPKGDSRTEFVLNAPAFANSKFYGSTISIERFSTAPYQLNIMLTGSNEAVNLFNQNIPNLTAAFRNGNFSFTINRIEAAYEKPVFRRKDSAGEKDEKGRGFGGSMDNRKK